MPILNDPIYPERRVTAIWGGRLGIGKANELVGPIGIAAAMSTLGSSAVSVPAHGVTILNAAAASTYVLDTPVPGVEKHFFQVGVGSSHNIITGTSNVKIISTLGSSQQRLAFQTTGDAATLYAKSTSEWILMNVTAGVSITT